MGPLSILDLAFVGEGETPDTVVAYLDEFQHDTGADELIVVHHAPTVAGRLRSVELLADAAKLSVPAQQGPPPPSTR